jgi:hypothetical protein
MAHGRTLVRSAVCSVNLQAQAELTMLPLIIYSNKSKVLFLPISRGRGCVRVSDFSR